MIFVTVIIKTIPTTCNSKFYMSNFIACRDAETWCPFVKNSALCSGYDIGIKICPQSCGKCQGIVGFLLYLSLIFSKSL